MDLNKLFSLEGRVALVTGGHRGIGRMITEGFLAQGAKVYISGRKADACKAAADEMGDNCIAVPGDVRSEEHTSELQSRPHLVCRLLLEKKKKKTHTTSLRPGNRFTRPATCAKQHRQIGACRLLPDRGQKGCRTDVSFLSHSRTTHTFNP